jgi:3-(3-hydroxy-phenyl)propionate hydroxylase
MKQELQTFDVVISGLGPTGLTLAHLLGQRGIQVLVLEREPHFYGNARAVYTDDECMRIFQSMGLAEELAKDMLQDTVVQMVLKDGTVLFQINDPTRVYGWSPSYFFYQPLLETTLAQTLERYPNVRVLRGREVLSFEQDASLVTIRHASTDGLQYGKTANTQTVSGAKPAVNESDVQSVQSRYFVGCDGGRSTVRSQLGIEMTGKSFPNPWLVVDIKAKDPSDGLNHLPYFNFVCDPECPTVSCVQPYGHHRFEFMLMPGQTKEYMESPETIRKLLSRHVDPDKFEVLRSLVYTFNALIAAQWRKDRVFLAGDAAHMTPQFIGQGMNAGVRDAYNLAWKLDAVLSGKASSKLLDTYQSERRPHVHDMIKTAVDMKSFVSVANPILGFLRNGLTKLALATPGLGKFIQSGAFIPQPFYTNGQFFGEPRKRSTNASGRWLPQPEIRNSEGRSQRLDELLGNGFALLGLGVDPRQSLSKESLLLWERQVTSFVAAYPFGGRPQGNVSRKTPEGLQIAEDRTGALFDWLKKHNACLGDIVIVRPDRFIFDVVPAKRIEHTTQKFARQWHASHMFTEISV